MSFLASLFRKPEPAPFEPARALNGQYLPSIRERRRRANEASVRMQLELMKAVTPPDMLVAAIERGATRSVLNRQTEEGRAGK